MEKPLRFCAVAVMAFATSIPMLWRSVSLANEASSAVPLAEQVAQLELSWHPGDGKREYDYYSRAAQLGRSLFRYDTVAANAAGVDLLDNLLAKWHINAEVREADFEVTVADLIALSDVASYLLAVGNVDVGDQREKIQPFAKLLGRIRAELVPGYAPKPVARGLTVIDSPATRKENEAAIRANNLNSLTNSRQRELHDMEARFAEPVVDYLVRVSASDPGARTLVQVAIDDARLTDSEKAEVMRAVSR